jgi:hypothetical protein
MISVERHVRRAIPGSADLLAASIYDGRLRVGWLNDFFIHHFTGA